MTHKNFLECAFVVYDYKLSKGDNIFAMVKEKIYEEVTTSVVDFVKLPIMGL